MRSMRSSAIGETPLARARSTRSAQGGDGQRLEGRFDAAAPGRAGRHGQHRGDVGQRLRCAAQFGQADHAVDQQHAEQPRVLQPRTAGQALLDMLQAVLVIADLQQLVREVAVQHRVEAVAARRAGVAQRLEHVREGLRRLAQRRVAAGDGVEQHAALVVAQHAHALVAQRQHRGKRLAHAAFAPHRARQRGAGQQVAGAVAAALEALQGMLQLAPGLGHGAEVELVVAQRDARPAFGDDVAAAHRGIEGALGEAARLRRIDVQQVPGAARLAQRRRRKRARGRHAAHYPLAKSLRDRISAPGRHGPGGARRGIVRTGAQTPRGSAWRHVIPTPAGPAARIPRWSGAR